MTYWNLALISFLILFLGCAKKIAATSVSPVIAPATQAQFSAAENTANNNSLCHTIQPFYWEIGDKTSTLVSSTVGGTSPTQSTSFPIASASKLLFSAYVAEKRAGKLTTNDIKYLNFKSGYTSLDYILCLLTSTVSDCMNVSSNSTYNAADDGKFYYDGGHMQKLAVDLGLGSYTNAQLANEFKNYLGNDLTFIFNSPQIAGGITSSALDYGNFLKKVLNQHLMIYNLLGANAVCTNPSTCANADYTPIPSVESWHYSLGHWVEDDPAVGDGAFSSPGLFGFYPWIDSGKNYYGIISRFGTTTTAYLDSVLCGRAIRKAWLTGVQQ